MSETFGERLRRLRLAKGFNTPGQLADAIGVSRTAIVLVENGQSQSLSAPNMLKAAEVLDVEPDELQFGVRALGEEEVPYGGKKAANRFRRNPARFRDVPIIGYVVGSPDQDGYYEDMDFPVGAGEGTIPWPTRDPNAYAVRVRKDSMAPRIRPGELIVVEPNTAVAPGDDVVVRTKSGRKMVKQLLHQRGDEVTLGSINQAHRQTTINLEEIDSMHFIAGIVQRGANVKEDL